MFSKNFQRKYALTDQGVKNVKKGAFWTVIVNLVVMGGMGILYLLMYSLMGTFTDDQPLPNAALLLGLVVVFLILSFVTHLQQYYATYGLVYNEVRSTRLSLAERLRKLPLGYFGKRDLADLTETIMGDVNRMEHVWSHVLGYLYGAYISTAIIAVCLLVYDWRLAIACLWGVPVAFGLLFGTRRISARTSERTKKAAIRVSNGIQEALENVREIRATNQEERYLAGLNQKIDDHEKVTIQGELGTGIFVNAASVIMRMGVATTILVGASLILSGQIDFMLLFLFLLVITRVYAPFDQSLALIAEMFVSQVSADRMNEIFYFVKQSELFHVRHNLFAAFKTVHAFVFACAFIHLRILCEHVDEVKIMAQTDFEVVRVVCGSDLYAAGSFFGIGMLVFNDRNFTVRERKIDSFSDKVLISWIADRHRDRGISEHGFRTGCGNDQKAGTVGQRIFEVIELAVFLLVDDFLIGERRFGNGAPVDHALAAFDISFVVQLYKDLFDGVAEPFVHGETLALPVAGCAEFAELPDDGSAILLAPCPDPFDELLPSEFVASGSLFFAEIFFDAAFGCDAGVVGSGEPADFIAFHSVPARENILKRIVENMPHGQDAGHVRRGDHDGIRFFIGIGLAVEKAVVFPVGIPFFLDGRGFVCFRHL